MKTSLRKKSTSSGSGVSTPFFNKTKDRKSSGLTPSPFFKAHPIQAKLKVGASNDAFEQEADAMADKVVQSSEGNQSMPTIQRKAEGNVGAEASANLEGQLQASKGHGQTLPQKNQEEMSASFGADFKDVKIHTDAKAVEMNQELGARAFTHGKDIYFDQNTFQPETTSGKKLLAHELTHVVQQSGGRAGKTIQRNPRGGRKMIGGGLRIHKSAINDVLKGGGLLTSKDNKQITIDSRGGLVKYNANYKKPVDPFRWNMLKDIIDSKEKVMVKFVGPSDEVEHKQVSPAGAQIVKKKFISLRVAGLMLPTESRQKSIYPGLSKYICSPHPDTHVVYYSKLMGGSAKKSPLAHEVFGHLWLAIKKVPFAHPKSKAAIKQRGTLDASHGIKDPQGNLYTGTVENFISEYVTATIFNLAESPTHFVGPDLLKKSLKNFKKDFAKKAKAKLNKEWNYKGNYIYFFQLSQNYRFAGSGKNPTSKAGMLKDITTWYNSLSVDKQYAFYLFIHSQKSELRWSTDLAHDLFDTLKMPKGMMDLSNLK